MELSVSYVISGNLTESQIEADVAQYLGWCSDGLPFRLHDVNEQLTGADKMSDVAVPIYIQFKKSTGLHSVATHPIKSRTNRSSLQDIRRFRADHELPDEPTLFFGLRKPAKNAIDLQHNILMAHQRPPASYAIYVAPLHLDRKDYYDELCSGPRYRDDPWDWHLPQMIAGWRSSSWLRRFDREPFLRNHISITPHQEVKHHKHHYAYSTAGDSVSWHSGEVLGRGTSRLSEFMSVRARQLLSGDYDLPHPEAGLKVAREFLISTGRTDDSLFDGDGLLEQLSNYGGWLWREHGIRQIILHGNRKDLLEVRERQK